MDIKKKDNLNRYLWASVIAHLIFIFIFTGVFKFSDDEFIIPPSIQVDLVAPPEALPQKTAEPVAQPEPNPEPEPVPEPKPDKKLPEKEPEVKKEPEGPKVNLEQEKKKKELEKKKKEKEKEKKLKEEKRKKELEKKKKQKKKKEQELKKNQDQAINKLKQKAALDKLLKSKTAESKPMTGDRLNPGTSFAGMDAIQFSKYYDSLKVHLFNNWSLPQWLSELNFKAQDLVVIDENGYVIKKEIIKSSGNSTFDNTILGAIEKASPFPVAPDRLKSKVKNKEIVFGFPEN